MSSQTSTEDATDEPGSSFLNALSPLSTEAASGVNSSGGSGGTSLSAIAVTHRRKRRPRARPNGPSVEGDDASGPVGVGGSGPPSLPLTPDHRSSASEAATGRVASAGGAHSNEQTNPFNSDNSLVCAVCGDEALGFNYDCLSCESCKTFFRRSAFLDLKCTRGCNCEVNLLTRRNCSACRFEKCLKAGMKREYIVKDACRGIGVPKRDPPARHARVRDGPKRTYRKRQNAWPSLRPTCAKLPTEENGMQLQLNSVESPQSSNPDVERELRVGTAFATFGGDRSAHLSPASVSWSESSIGSAQDKAFVQSNSVSSPHLLAPSSMDSSTMSASLPPGAFYAPSCTSPFTYPSSCASSCTGGSAGAGSMSPNINTVSPSGQLSSKPLGTVRGLLGTGTNDPVEMEESGFLPQRSREESSRIRSSQSFTGGHSTQCDIQTTSFQAHTPLVAQAFGSASSTLWTPQTHIRVQPPPAPVTVPKTERFTPPPIDYTGTRFAEPEFSSQVMGAHNTMIPSPNVALTPPFPSTMPFTSPLPAQFLENFVSSAAALSSPPIRQVEILPSAQQLLFPERSQAGGTPWVTSAPHADSRPSTRIPSAPANANTLNTLNSGTISLQCDPRARQSADKALVTHTLRVEPSPDPRFDLFITTESRCSSVARSIAVSVARLSAAESAAMYNSLRAALQETRQPLNATEAATLPRVQSNAYESFAYVEHVLRNAIRGLKLLPDFSTLPIADQMDILKAASSAIIRLLIAFHADTELMAFVHWVSPEYVKAGHPNDSVRVNLFVDVANVELCAGLLETSAVMINSVNFAIGIHQHCGRDALLMYLIVLINIFSPHRYLAKPHLLAAVTPLHAKLLEFLRQYLEVSSQQRSHMFNQKQEPQQNPFLIPPQNHSPQTTNTSHLISTNFSAHLNFQSGHSATSASPSMNFLTSNFNTYPTYALGSHACSFDKLNRDSHRFPVSITPDFENDTMLGVYLAGLAGLSDEQRQHLKSLIVNVQICEQLDKTMMQKFGITQSPKSSLTDKCEERECWREQFAFCVAALNDVRMSEVTLRDHELRWAISEQYTPLFNELLSMAQPAEDSASLHQPEAPI